MRILDLINVIKSGVPGVTIYPNVFPVGGADDCVVVRLTGGAAPDDMLPISRPSIQVIVRAKNPSTAEININAIYAFLNRKEQFDIGTVRAVYCLALNSSPIYLGEDENERTLYSANFIFTTKQ